MPIVSELTADIPLVIEYFIMIVLGLVLGSFSTAIIYRVPRELPWAFEGKRANQTVSAFRSACTSCKTALQPVDLIPLVSWIRSKGKCRYCQAPIGYVYPAVELTVLLGVLSAYWAFGLTMEGMIVAACVPFLVALLVIDLEYMILPDQLVLIVGILGLLKLIFDVFYYEILYLQDAFLNYICGALLYAGLAWFLGWLMTVLLKKEALGFGDVKFFAVAGLWLGLLKLGWFCLLAGVLGFAFALAWKMIKQDEVFPFGPALIASFYILLLAESSNFL